MSLLADSLLKQYSKPRIAKLSGSFTKELAVARKFSLDADASRFCLDIANSSRSVSELNELRHLARLPYDVTWIEYDAFARNNYACDLDQVSRMEMVDSPKVCGYICRNTDIENVFIATECYSHGFEMDMKTVKDIPILYYFSMVWRTDDTADLPFKGIGTNRLDPRLDTASKYIVGQLEDSLKGLPDEHLLVTACPYYNPGMAVGMARKEKFGPEQHAGALKYLWAVLATINQVPVGMTEFRPSKGQMVAGSYKKFMEHKVISLNIPAKRYNTLRKIVSHAKRRAHQVRGFWRKPRANQKQQELRWIASHQRGDASIGFVTHDYEVKHGQD